MAYIDESNAIEMHTKSYIMNQYEKGLVSVIIPTYKRTDKLDRAIKSVLGQSYKNIELLLVNDNVPDDEYTLTLMEKVKAYQNDSRFQLLLQEKHINGAVARNFAIRQARGEYIAFLDDDDWWEIDKLADQVKELSSLGENWGGVSCKMTFYDESMNVISKSRKYRDGNIYKDILMLQSDVATGTLLLRHSALDEVGYFDENLLRNQDLQLLAFFTYRFRLKEVNKYLHCVDVSDNQNRASDGYKAITIKENFYKSVSPILKTLTKSEMLCVDSMRNFEIAYIFFRGHDYRNAFKYGMSMFRSPKAFYLALCKIFDRLILCKF